MVRKLIMNQIKNVRVILSFILKHPELQFCPNSSMQVRFIPIKIKSQSDKHSKLNQLKVYVALALNKQK